MDIFFVLLAPAYIIYASLTNYAMALGFVAVPAIVGYLIIRRAIFTFWLVVAYAIYAVLLYGLVAQEVFETYRETKVSIRGVCMTRNQDVASLPESKRSLYCGCLANQLAFPALAVAAAANVTFGVLAGVPNNSWLRSKSYEAAARCAALL